MTFQKIVKNGRWGSGSGDVKCQGRTQKDIFCCFAYCCVWLWFKTFRGAYEIAVCDKWLIFTARKRSLGQGNVLTPVCDSVHRGVSAPLHAGTQPPPPPGKTPPKQTPPFRYYTICSTSGRYASYWNAYLQHSCLLVLYEILPDLEMTN